MAVISKFMLARDRTRGEVLTLFSTAANTAGKSVSGTSFTRLALLLVIVVEKECSVVGGGALLIAPIDLRAKVLQRHGNQNAGQGFQSACGTASALGDQGLLAFDGLAPSSQRPQALGEPLHALKLLRGDGQVAPQQIEGHFAQGIHLVACLIKVRLPAGLLQVSSFRKSTFLLMRAGNLMVTGPEAGFRVLLRRAEEKMTKVAPVPSFCAFSWGGWGGVLGSKATFSS